MAEDAGEPISAASRESDGRLRLTWLWREPRRWRRAAVTGSRRGVRQCGKVRHPGQRMANALPSPGPKSLWPILVVRKSESVVGSTAMHISGSNPSRSAILLRAERFAVPTTSFANLPADPEAPLRIGRDLFSERFLCNVGDDVENQSEGLREEHASVGPGIDRHFGRWPRCRMVGGQGCAGGPKRRGLRFSERLNTRPSECASGTQAK